MVSMYLGTGSQKSYSFDVENQSGTYKLRFVYSTDGSAESSLQGTVTPSTGVWYRACVDRGNDSLRIYWDGALINSVDLAGASFHNSTTTTKFGALSSTVNELDGWLDEVRIIKGAAAYGNEFGFDVPEEELTF